MKEGGLGLEVRGRREKEVKEEKEGMGVDQVLVQEEIDSDALNPDIYAKTFLICGFISF